MRFVLNLGIVVLFALAIPLSSSAHCPLCTIGAGAVATGALFLGVKHAVVGVFLGAFAAALGWWVGSRISRNYIPHQNAAIAVASWVATILPLKPLLKNYVPLFIAWFGEYGSLFNRTYILDAFLVGSIVGGIIVLTSPALSRQVTRMRGGAVIPFQGVSITFLLLFIAALVFQFFLWTSY